MEMGMPEGRGLTPLCVCVDLVRREQDILHINHQLREVNAAYKEVDGLVTEQGEVVGT